MRYLYLGILSILLIASVSATNFQYDNPGLPSLQPNPNLCSVACTTNISSIFNETDPVQPWTNDSGQIFPKKGFPNTITTRLNQTDNGFVVTGNVTDGFISQGFTSMDAVTNAFAFASEDTFAPTVNNQEWWSMLAAPVLFTNNASRTVSEFIGFLSAPSTLLTHGFNFAGTVNNVSSYESEITWSNGTVNNMALYKGKPVNKVAGTIDNLYGLWLPDIQEGTNNTAIRTGKGKVTFGDSVFFLGSNLSYKNATNNIMDRCTLSSGICTIANNQVTTNTNIFCFEQTQGGTIGSIGISGRNAGVNYTVASSNVLDTSVVACTLINPFGG